MSYLSKQVLEHFCSLLQTILKNKQMNQFLFSFLHKMDYEKKEVCRMSNGGCYGQGGYGGGTGGHGLGSGFALLVVLFILLIIVAASFGYGNNGGYGGGASC